MLELGADKEAKDCVRTPHTTAAALCVGARRVRQSAGRVQPCMRSVPRYLSRLGCLLAALRRGAAFVRSRTEWQDATALGGTEGSSGGRTAAAGARRGHGGQRFRARPTRHSRCALRRSVARTALSWPGAAAPALRPTLRLTPWLIVGCTEAWLCFCAVARRAKLHCTLRQSTANWRSCGCCWSSARTRRPTTRCAPHPSRPQLAASERGADGAQLAGSAAVLSWLGAAAPARRAAPCAVRMTGRVDAAGGRASGRLLEHRGSRADR